MPTQLMEKKAKHSDKVQLNFDIPKDLDIELRMLIQRKFGIYRRGQMTQVLEQSIRQFIETETEQ
jgi:hypothetical protein